MTAPWSGKSTATRKLGLSGPSSGWSTSSAGRRRRSWNNPTTSIGADELQVEILQDGKPVTGSEIRLEYTRGEGDEWIDPEVHDPFENAGKRTLFVGTARPAPDLRYFQHPEQVGCQRLEKGQETFANDGDPIPVTVPDEFWERGVVEIKDILKVIVSTSAFDARRLEQTDLDLARNRAADLERRGVTWGLGELGTLERLMGVQTRQMGQEPTRRIDDWRTLQRPSQLSGRCPPNASSPAGL